MNNKHDAGLNPDQEAQIRRALNRRVEENASGMQSKEWNQIMENAQSTHRSPITKLVAVAASVIAILAVAGAIMVATRNGTASDNATTSKKKDDPAKVSTRPLSPEEKLLAGASGLNGAEAKDRVTTSGVCDSEPDKIGRFDSPDGKSYVEYVLCPGSLNANSGITVVDIESGKNRRIKTELGAVATEAIDGGYAEVGDRPFATPVKAIWAGNDHLVLTLETGVYRDGEYISVQVYSFKVVDLTKSVSLISTPDIPFSEVACCLSPGVGTIVDARYVDGRLLLLVNYIELQIRQNGDEETEDSWTTIHVMDAQTGKDVWTYTGSGTPTDAKDNGFVASGFGLTTDVVYGATVRDYAADKAFAYDHSTQTVVTSDEYEVFVPKK